MGEIFINYRRDDTAGEARALFNELRERVGDNAVFMDVDNIALGRDFREVLTERLATVDVMLALIGINWLDAKDKSGRRRLDDPNDFVRREIRAALQRNIAVTPVLLKDATMPAEADLPEDIRALAFRNAFELTHSRWGSDVNELVHRLGLVASPAAAAGTPSPPAEPRPTMAAATPSTPSTGRFKSPLGAIAAVVSALIAGAGGYWYYQGEQAKEAELRQGQLAADQARRDAEEKLAEARVQAARQAEAQARLDRERFAAQQAAEARQIAAAKLAETQRAAAAKEAAAEAQRLADARQRTEMQRIAEAKQAADQAARDKAAAMATAAMATATSAQATASKLAPTEADTQARLMAAVQAGKWISSISVGLGDYGIWKSLSWSQLDAGAAVTPCTKWAGTFGTEDRARFLVSCLGAASYFNRTGMPVGRRASQTYWNTYCGQLASAVKLVGPDRDRLIAVCSQYR